MIKGWTKGPLIRRFLLSIFVSVSRPWVSGCSGTAKLPCCIRLARVALAGRKEDCDSLIAVSVHLQIFFSFSPREQADCVDTVWLACDRLGQCQIQSQWWTWCNLARSSLPGLNACDVQAQCGRLFKPKIMNFITFIFFLKRKQLKSGENLNSGEKQTNKRSLQKKRKCNISQSCCLS